MSILPITDAVQAAIYYAKPHDLTNDQFVIAYDEMAKRITDYDKERVSPHLAAAARILADEVVRLREELKTNKTIIFPAILSDCCEAPAVLAGKSGSTQWYVCPQCCQPCDVFIRETTQQPL